MSKVHVNAIFYSNRNMNMAYELKMAARELGVSVLYAFDPAELTKYLNEFKISIIFIDCLSINIDNSLLAFIKSYPKSKNPIIIGIESRECGDTNYNKKDGIDYTISFNNLRKDLTEIESALLHFYVINRNSNFDYCEVNKFLTNYLISIGMAPKHVGFTFIKQTVEAALKNNGVLGSLSREVYPTVATKNKTLPQNVERNIRNSIESACKTFEIFSDDIKNLIANGRISNRDFLCYLLDKTLNTFSNTENSSASVG